MVTATATRTEKKWAAEEAALRVRGVTLSPRLPARRRGKYTRRLRRSHGSSTTARSWGSPGHSGSTDCAATRIWGTVPRALWA
jgi:hypothetical protein